MHIEAAGRSAAGEVPGTPFHIIFEYSNPQIKLPIGSEESQIQLFNYGKSSKTILDDMRQYQHIIRLRSRASTRSQRRQRTSSGSSD